jgi:hypothetical protein
VPGSWIPPRAAAKITGAVKCVPLNLGT